MEVRLLVRLSSISAASAVSADFALEYFLRISPPPLKINMAKFNYVHEYIHPGSIYLSWCDIDKYLSNLIFKFINGYISRKEGFGFIIFIAQHSLV